MSLKLVREELTLVYGLQLFHGTPEGPGALPHAHVEVRGPRGQEATLALHTLTGTREELRRQLVQSIDAFLELVDPVGTGE
jgi:hypothetical protein